jgi:hypothetical protein
MTLNIEHSHLLGWLAIITWVQMILLVLLLSIVVDQEKLRNEAQSRAIFRDCQISGQEHHQHDSGREGMELDHEALVPRAP